MSSTLAEASPIDPPPRNRLTIAFLMLWTLGSAIVLACNRALEDPQLGNQLGLAYSLYLMCYAIAQGVAVASVPLFIARRMTRQGGFPTQPGHWILLIRGLTMLAWLAGWASRVAIERLLPEESRLGSAFPNLYLAMQYAPASLLACIGYAVARHYSPNEGRIWRLTLASMQISAGLGLMAALALIAARHPFGGELIPYSLNSCLNPLIALLLISALVSDPKRQSRDFLYWAGAASYLAMTLLPFGYASLAYFLRS
jgi:hypothetical protein